ncbi:MAG: carbohydrate ABC transporter permease [Clostridia bacterium]
MKKALRMALLIVLAAVFLSPVVITLTGSFMGQAELGQVFSGKTASLRLIPRKATLNGYCELLFAGGKYLGMFWNSVLLAAAISLGSTVVGLVVGYVLAKRKFRGRDALRFLYIVMMMMPFQVTLLPNYIMLKQMSLYNTNWALILPGVFAPFGVFLMSQFIRSMSDEMIEAATLETNSPIKVLAHIVAPMVYPGLLALFLLSFADAWNMVEQPLILLQDTWKYPLSLALNNMREGDMSISFAGAVLYMLPVVFLYRIFEEELIEGLSVAKF